MIDAPPGVEVAGRTRSAASPARSSMASRSGASGEATSAAAPSFVVFASIATFGA